MKWKIILLMLSFAVVYGCSSSSNKKPDQKELQEYLEKGKAISMETLSVFQKNLKKAIKSGGIDTAINYCHSKAMFLSDSISHAKGVKVRRIAKKNRNPFNFLDEQSMPVYTKYEKLMAEGKPLKPVVIINKKGNPVYYAPIKIGKDVCLKCHGSIGKQVPESRVEMLKKYYPEDKALGFKKGDLRGMWEITFTGVTLK